MKKVDVLLGLQWGDEGKGKIVDYLCTGYDIIARFQGGPNAGHSLEFDNVKHVLHNIPSGIFRPNTINIIGNGVVLCPTVFKKEVDTIEKMGVDILKNLYVSRKAHLILPSHRILDKASEAAKGDTKIGSTQKGIGPTYMDKTGRNGLRVGDITTPGFMAKYQALLKKHQELLKMYDFQYDLKEFEEGWFEGIESIKRFKHIDSEHYIHNERQNNKTILAEGAQGTLLDIDFGSYPFVTSSNTICAGACTGLGIAPNAVGEVIGIFKAYCTRVGSGPFPTELNNDTGEQIRQAGHEFGATTGRPRRVGWLDLVALKYAIMLNGATKLVMTKADVLSGFGALKICTAYNTPEGVITHFPYSIEEGITPVYTEMEGWGGDLTGINTYEKIPASLKKYIQFIEDEVKVPVSIVSLGPNRDQTIIR